MKEDNLEQRFTNSEVDPTLASFEALESDALALIDLVNTYLTSGAYKGDRQYER